MPVVNGLDAPTRRKVLALISKKRQEMQFTFEQHALDAEKRKRPHDRRKCYWCLYGEAVLDGIDYAKLALR